MNLMEFFSHEDSEFGHVLNLAVLVEFAGHRVGRTLYTELGSQGTSNEVPQGTEIGTLLQ